MQFKPDNSTQFYQAFGEYQASNDSWDLCEFVAWLQTWARRFNEEFELGITAVSLCVDWLGAHRLGHFRRGHNGFGLSSEIAINRKYLSSREPWQILGTLLHELLHAWQEDYGKAGKNNYHNKQFREKARSLGLIINARGYTQYEPDSPFFAVLQRHGVETPKVPPPQYVVRGSSKLKKWACQCQPPINVRVAVAHFYARCLWCGELYRHVD
jgi:hypothetical protein